MGGQIDQSDKNRDEPQHVQDQNDAFDHRQKPTNHGIDEDCDSENGPAEESTMPLVRLVVGVI